MAHTLARLDWQALPEGLPLFKRISEAIVREILRGRLRAGARLPSSRGLSKDLGVHRNTVLAAYSELTAQGYVVTAPAKGTFIAMDLPEAAAQKGRRVRTTRPVELRLAAPPPGSGRPELLDSSLLPLLGGLPDLRELPVATFARAYRHALRASPETLDYQDVYGQARFLRVFASYLAETRGVVAGPGEMMVTRGSQQALFLAARALCRPGAVIAVEHAGYSPAWQAFRMAGAEIIPVRVDRSGLRVDELRRLCSEHDVAAVYVTPHHQYPTTVTMSAARRIQLLELAKDAQFVVMEDDYDHEYHFESRPILPLASTDDARVVLHIGTLSKVLAPGLRVGYAVGQAKLLERMAHNRLFIDRQGDHAVELALSYLIEDGELSAHVRRMRRHYVKRRQALLSSVTSLLGHAISFHTPAGGLALWCRVHTGVSAQAWAEQARREGVLVQPGRLFYFDGRDRPEMRLGYARLNESEIALAVRRLARAHTRLRSAAMK